MPEADFTGKSILIGVSGGIAAYKVVELARLLVKSGADVKVVMTAAGERFVTPLTFRTVTGNPVATTLWADPASPFPHISLADEADLIIVAPATADIIARYARGVADDLLSTTLIAAKGTVVVAPAMNHRMYRHPATRENLAILESRGVVVVEPGVGGLACGEEGVGRMAEPAEIMDVLAGELAHEGELEGRRVLVTAGPTREYIDPVRFLSNPSTGMMGFAIAERAARRGAEVTLIAGPTGLTPPAGVGVLEVVSAADMKSAVEDNIGEADVLVMAAAVADYRPAEKADKKLKKRDGIPGLVLERTEDILKSLKAARGDCLLVGFAAETDDVIDNAKRKLVEKELDFIVANRVDGPGTGFATATNLAVIISSEAEEAGLTMMTKLELADLLLDRISAKLGAQA